MENRNLGLSDGDDLAPNSALAVDDLAGDVDLEQCDAWAHNLLVLAARLDDAAAPKPLPCDGHGATDEGSSAAAGGTKDTEGPINLVVNRYRGQWLSLESSIILGSDSPTVS